MYCRNCGNEMNNEAVICVKCGVPTGKGNNYCPNCGAQTHPEAVICTTCGVALKKNKAPINTNIKPRNLVTAILLSFVTCGIYSIYWFIKLTDEMNELSDNEGDASGGMAFLFNLLTCGIYGYYWAYRMGVKRDLLEEKSSSSGVIYLILSIVGLQIVAYALAQDAINKVVEKA